MSLLGSKRLLGTLSFGRSWHPQDGVKSIPAHVEPVFAHQLQRPYRNPGYLNKVKHRKVYKYLILSPISNESLRFKSRGSVKCRSGVIAAKRAKEECLDLVLLSDLFLAQLLRED